MNKISVKQAVKPMKVTSRSERNRYDVSDVCKEIHDVVFLKVHKTGSSTFANILERFGESRNLNFAIPNKRQGEGRYNYIGGIGDTISDDNIQSSKVRNHSYNIFYNHVIFNYTAFRLVFRRPMTYVTLVRDPLSQFISSVMFFVHQEDVFNAVTNNLTEYLLSPEKLEPDNPYLSYTNNRQALDLGIPPDRRHDVSFIRHYIKMLDKTFDLVLIMEKFDESLVILKRKLCWGLKDILYIPMNKGYKNIPINVTRQDKSLHRKWAIADHLIYDHFREKLINRIQKEEKLDEEVQHFKQILTSVQNFCRWKQGAGKLAIAASSWNEPFTVTSVDCLFLTISELQFLQKIHRRLGIDKTM